MSIIVRRVGIVTLLVLAATALWIGRIDHRHEASADTPSTVGPPSGFGDVVVATRSIDAGDMIEPAFIGVVRRPVRMIPTEAFSHVDNVMGRVANVNIDAGEVITNARLAGPFAPKLDPRAKRTVIVRVDLRASDASIEPNTLVDLLVVPGLGDPDRVVETLLHGVRVVNFGSVTANRPDAKWYAVTTAAIVVTLEQQERLATALAGGPRRIALRRHADTAMSKR